MMHATSTRMYSDSCSHISVWHSQYKHTLTRRMQPSDLMLPIAYIFHIQVTNYGHGELMREGALGRVYSPLLSEQLGEVQRLEA
jgi:hypothetical protein